MTTISQRSFSAGEVSPSLYARVDLTKYATGLRTCKNNIVLRYGGLSNRPGTDYITEVSDSSKVVKLIPFVFNTDQTYVLEFGNLYMRVIKDGILQRLASDTITGVTQANPGVVSCVNTYSNGDEVLISDIVGMSELNTRSFKVSNVTGTTFELQDMSGTNFDTSALTAYTSGGISEKVYEVVTTYTDSEVQSINLIQSADIITLVHPSHAPAELARTGDTSWTLTDISFQPTIGGPTNLGLAVGGAGALTFRYKVTAISAEDGEESLSGIDPTTLTIGGVTLADPPVITTTASHALNTGDEIFIKDTVGTTEINNQVFVITVLTATTFELDNIDATGFTAWTSVGSVNRAFIENIAAAAPTSVAPHVISWNKVSNAIEYNIYKETNGTYGQIGIATGTSFDDINITADTSFIPPSSRIPFLGTDNYPSVVTYIQQRLGFANTNNDTEKIFLSRTGNFKNFTRSTPLQADDAVTFTMAGQRVNAVKGMIDLGRLIVTTSGGEWSAAGDSAGIISPTSINTKQYSYNGSGSLQPIIIDGAAVYQQARGSIIRDLNYDFQIDGYSGNDLTIFSAHLFDKFTLTDWAFQQIPHSILWVVRSDGVLLGMTFVRNQNVRAWHVHDLGGLVENVAVIPEGNEDVLYVVVKRTIDGATKRYIEKLSTRQITDIVENKFMDSNLTFDGRNTGSTTMTLSGGSTWESTESLTLTASAGFFNANDVGNAIHLRGASLELIRATITAFTSTTIVTVKPHRTVPTDLRTIAVTDWDEAVDQVAGLWHLEGKDVSVFGDGFVVASPNNVSYDTVTVSNGTVTLDKPYAVIHVGLPYYSDIETLDIDSPNGETIADKSKIVGEVNLYVEETRGIWSGATPPTDDTVDPLGGLTELKIRSTEDYDSPVNLTTDNVSILIRPEWNSNGRVFIRQVDPIPMTILSINPAGKFPFGG